MIKHSIIYYYLLSIYADHAFRSRPIHHRDIRLTHKKYTQDDFRERKKKKKRGDNKRELSVPLHRKRKKGRRHAFFDRDAMEINMEAEEEDAKDVGRSKENDSIEGESSIGKDGPEVNTGEGMKLT